MTDIYVYSDEYFDQELRGYKEKVKYHAIITKAEIRYSKNSGYEMPSFVLSVDCETSKPLTVYVNLPIIPEGLPGHAISAKSIKDFLFAVNEPFVKKAMDNIEKFNNKELKVTLAPSKNNSNYPAVKEFLPLNEMNENPEVQEEKPKDASPEEKEKFDDDIPF